MATANSADARPAVPDPRDELITHLPALRAFALSLTRSGASADDLVQDTVVKAWTHIDRFELGTNMRAWLFAILRNTFYSGRRRSARRCPSTLRRTSRPSRLSR